VPGEYMNEVNTPLLGRRYAGDILTALSEARELTFTYLLHEVSTCRRTLSLTLTDLLDEGLVVKRSRGKYSYYSITERGMEILSAHSGSRDNFIVERITQLSLKTLKNMGLLEENEDITEEQLTHITRRKVVEFMKKLREDASKQSKGDLEAGDSS